jgi:hypothetical protein
LWFLDLGESKPEFFMAALTRSRASSTALSGKPTIAKAFKPREISVSTDIGITERRFV